MCRKGYVVYSIPPFPSHIVSEKDILCVTDLPDTDFLHLNFQMTSGPRPILCGLVLSRAGVLWAPRTFWLWRLLVRPSENRSEYRFTNTQKRIFHACIYYGAYPWNGIFGEGSIPCRNSLPASASAAGREI